MAAKQFQAALAEYEAAKNIDPANSVIKHNIAECYNNWGISYFRQKHYSDAVAQFQKCLAILPNHGHARYNMTLCKRAMEAEGISDEPAADDKPEPKGKSEEKEKPKEDLSPKVTVSDAGGSGNSSADISYGTKTLFGSMSGSTSAKFVSGSTAFPVYSASPSAVNSAVVSSIPKVPNPPTASGTRSPDGSLQIIPPGKASSHADVFSAGSVSDDGNATSSNSGEAKSVTTNSTGTNLTSSGSLSGGAGTSTTQSTLNSAEQTAQAAVANSLFPTLAGTNSGATTIPGSGPQIAATTQSSQTVSSYDGPAGAVPTLEDRVSTLELKVYGKKHDDQPLMKRIEQLETDFIGKVRQGPMSDRIDYLKQAIVKQ